MMKNLNNKLALIALMASASAMAATDGTLDATQSQGSTEVSVAVTEVVQVTFPNGDIPIPFSVTTTTPVTETFCIYTNAADNAVDVAIALLNDNNAGPGASAVLLSGTDKIEYSFALNIAGGAAIAAGIDEDGLAATSITSANNTSATCSDGMSHELVVTVPFANMAAAPVGNYTDTITVTVTPGV